MAIPRDRFFISTTLFVTVSTLALAGASASHQGVAGGSSAQIASCTGNAECNDFNACTDDSCDLGTGVCVHASRECHRQPCFMSYCDPLDGCITTGTLPTGEVTGVRFEVDKQTMSWERPFDSINPSYDVARGVVGEWPVGTGTSEACISSNILSTTAADPSSPSSGQSLWYLVRCQSSCGNGVGYGWAEINPNHRFLRTTSACP